MSSEQVELPEREEDRIAGAQIFNAEGNPSFLEIIGRQARLLRDKDAELAQAEHERKSQWVTLDKAVRYEFDRAERAEAALAAMKKPCGDWAMVNTREVLQEKNNLQAALAAAREENAWISVEKRLPEPSYSHNYMAWIKCDNKAGGYRELVAYGEWFCHRDDVEEGDEGYVDNNDEGNYRGYGWHRTEEAHGGDYDYITTGLNALVTHWRPLPSPPSVPAKESDADATQVSQ